MGQHCGVHGIQALHAYAWRLAAMTRQRSSGSTRTSLPRRITGSSPEAISRCTVLVEQSRLSAVLEMVSSGLRSPRFLVIAIKRVFGCGSHDRFAASCRQSLLGGSPGQKPSQLAKREMCDGSIGRRCGPRCGRLHRAARVAPPRHESAVIARATRHGCPSGAIRWRERSCLWRM